MDPKRGPMIVGVNNKIISILGPRYGSTRWPVNRAPLTIDREFGSTTPAWLDGWLASPANQSASPANQSASPAQPAKPSNICQWSPAQPILVPSSFFPCFLCLVMFPMPLPMSEEQEQTLNNQTTITDERLVLGSRRNAKQQLCHRFYSYTRALTYTFWMHFLCSPESLRWQKRGILSKGCLQQCHPRSKRQIGHCAFPNEL